MYLFKLDDQGNTWTTNYGRWEKTALKPTDEFWLKTVAQRVGTIKKNQRWVSYWCSTIDLDSPLGMMLQG